MKITLPSGQAWQLYSYTPKTKPLLVIVIIVKYKIVAVYYCIYPSYSNANHVFCKYLFTPSLKPGFHTCVSRTHNSARCLKMYGHQWSQAIIAFATKACELATKSHMLNFCEGLCPDMLWLWSIETNNARKKKFLSSRKKEQSQK